MKYIMKILDKYIDPIKKHQRIREYRLYDDKVKKIKVGDSILFISASNNNRFIRTKVKGFKFYETWEESLRNNWESDFSFTDMKYEEVLNEVQQYYRNDSIKKYGIIVYEIEPISYPFKNSRVLIDTNTVIYRESHLNVNFEVAELYRWFDKLKMTKLIHPFTINEISKYGNEQLRNVMISKLHAYEKIVPTSLEDDNFRVLMSKYSNDANSIIDNSILLQVYNDFADYLVTNDKIIIQKAKDLYLNDRVLSIAEFLKKIEDENPKLINYNMLSVRLKKFGEIDLENVFFDTLREDYLGFNKWFLKKNNEYAYIFENKEKILGFLYLKVEGDDENYYDIIPKLTAKKRLKVGTFKIDRSGFRLGERFLKIIFDNAIEKNVDEIYLTMFENKREEVNHLRKFMMDWGFYLHGHKESNGEIVLLKDMRLYNCSKDPKYNFPIIKKNPNYYFLPIDSKYHTDLFPDRILKNENMNLYKDNLSHRYSIEKIYISSAYYNPLPGDIVLIYRSGERLPKRFSSVLTGIAIIFNVFEPTTQDEYLALCNNKSVFNNDELKNFYFIKKWRKVIKLLDLKVFDKKIILNDLYKLGALEENTGPRPFTRINKEMYDKILIESMVNKLWKKF